MPRYQENSRPADAAPRGAGMESQNESLPHQNQLEVRPQGGSPEVWLQKETFYAVKDLVRAERAAVTFLSDPGDDAATGKHHDCGDRHRGGVGHVARDQ